IRQKPCCWRRRKCPRARLSPRRCCHSRCRWCHWWRAPGPSLRLCLVWRRGRRQRWHYSALCSWAPPIRLKVTRCRRCRAWQHSVPAAGVLLRGSVPLCKRRPVGAGSPAVLSACFLVELSTLIYSCISVYMNITLSIGERVWREFKAECVRRGLKASQLTEEYMRGMLKAWGVKLGEEPRKGGKRQKE